MTDPMPTILDILYPNPAIDRASLERAVVNALKEMK